MYAEERQHEIVSLARSLGRVSVAELATRYGVTPETIRRDLDALSARGLLSRVHGGAVPVDKLKLAEASLHDRAVTSPDQKLAIAERAVQLIPERAELTVLLDAGTTTARLCPILPPWVSTVVTNSVPIAGELAEREGLNVQLLGGQVRGITQATVGSDAYASLERFRVDVAFLGANGFSVDHGFSTPDPHEAAIKAAMIRTARHVYVVADATKFGSDYLVKFGALSDVDALVSDDRLPAASRLALEEAGLSVHIA